MHTMHIGALEAKAYEVAWKLFHELHKTERDNEARVQFVESLSTMLYHLPIRQFTKKQ